MQDINLFIAFVAGLVSFCAPCIIPLIPAYVGYITGVSVAELKNHGLRNHIKRLIFSTLLYTLGFSLFFVLLGTSAAGFGVLIRQNSLLLQRVGGIIILALGLEHIGLINVSFFNGGNHFSLPVWIENLGYLRAVVIGLVFATIWTPCIGPILGSILTLAAVSETAKGGAFLLFVYSLGISLPFILISLTLASAPKYLTFIKSHMNLILKISGFLLIALGFLLLSDTYRYLNAWFLNLAYRISYLFP